MVGVVAGRRGRQVGVAVGVVQVGRAGGVPGDVDAPAAERAAPGVAAGIFRGPAPGRCRGGFSGPGKGLILSPRGRTGDRMAQYCLVGPVRLAGFRR
ncbi:hypothetical protein GCM10010420_30610 [Streptomyces glaucosporus]|uniref:Secreted protein n=1 Tax=Streptomyces glaucosporus TaxID=284044 RepID=A0ABN3IDA8_9ACTN